MKKHFFLTAMAALLLSSCVTTKYSQSKTMDIINTGIVTLPVISDLDIQQTKIKGASSGSNENIEILKNEAVKSALIISNADVLIEPNFTIIVKEATAAIEVTGFPAKYKNLRTANKEELEMMELSHEIHIAKLYDQTQTKTAKKKKYSWGN